MPDPTHDRVLLGHDDEGRASRRSARERLLVLVVDDDAISLEVTRDRLERLGLEVATREQSLGTSRWILENKPDLVLLDLMMPALTGVELARLLRRHMTGVIVHSSLAAPDLARVAREVGAIGGLSKSLTDLPRPGHPDCAPPVSTRAPRPPPRARAPRGNGRPSLSFSRRRRAVPGA